MNITIHICAGTGFDQIPHVVEDAHRFTGNYNLCPHSSKGSVKAGTGILYVFRSNPMYAKV